MMLERLFSTSRPSHLFHNRPNPRVGLVYSSLIIPEAGFWVSAFGSVPADSSRPTRVSSPLVVNLRDGSFARRETRATHKNPRGNGT
ncbi:CCAAT-box-binding transcription factor [Anopheles sinensis]|uniref:CCAAT-box-binding transcription factor n=1 Tax=Anopheles sinensis TaxID=74873 RepID=A0A084WJX1_ANOSI|nr:CCAAT-box-binding transcription factor [Anopheles sinensis]